MTDLLPAIVRQVAEGLAKGATAAVQGSALLVTGADGSCTSIHCGRGDNAAQDLLDAATAEAATSDYDRFREAEANKRAVLAATNKATLLHERNRWLTETDPYVLPIPSLPSDMPADVLNVLSAQGTPSVQDQLKTWRQALRNYPATVTDWTEPPPLPAPPNITLPSGRPLVIVT